MEAKNRKRDYVGPQNVDMKMKFKDFCEVYKRDITPRIKLSTLRIKSNIIETKIIPYFGDKSMCAIRVSDVLGWQNILIGMLDKNGKKFSPCYLKTIHDQCSAIFNHAVRYYDLKSNPASKAGNMGKEKTKEMLFWTKEEYTNFSEAIRDKPDYYLAFEILYWCGLRKGEMLALTPSDFQFEKGTVRINKTYQRIGSEDIITDPKTPKSNRVVQMPAFLIKEVQTYIQSMEGIHPDARIFTMSSNSLRKVMKAGSLKAGVKTIRIHDLRHSHVSLLIELGFSALAIAERVGHESIDITYRYAHLFPTRQQEMADKLDMERKLGEIQLEK